MFIEVHKDLVYKYKFDSYDDSFLFINYDFSYDIDNPTATEDYDIDVQSITAVDSSIDLQFIIEGKIFDRIVNNIIDLLQEHYLNSLGDDNGHD